MAARDIIFFTIIVAGLPLLQGLISDIDITPQGNTFVLQRNQHLSLKCSAIVQVSSLEHIYVKPSDFALEWLANGLVTQREKLYSSPSNGRVLQGTIFLKAYHDASITHREYVCTLRQGDETILVNKATVVVMGNPPVSPKIVSSIYEQDTVIASAYDPLGQYIYNTLNTSHQVSVRGFNCSTAEAAQKWTYFNSCQSMERGAEHAIVCPVLISKEKELRMCTHYEGVLVVENSFGKTQSDLFVVQRAVDMDLKGTLSLRLASSTTSTLRFDIVTTARLSPLHDIIFQIKYRDINGTTSQTQLTQPNAKEALHTGLSPNECKYVSISSKLYVFGLNVEDFHWNEWTPEILACSMPEVIVQAPVHVTCRGVDSTAKNLREPSTLLLTWMVPVLTKNYGNVTHSLVRMEIRKLRDFVNMSVDASPDEVQKLYTKRGEYLLGGTIIFKIALCNSAGCSENISSCAVELEGGSQRSTFPPAEVPLLWIVLSVVVPVATIAALLLYAFVSYYTKMEIKADLGDFDQVQNDSHSEKRQELLSSTLVLEEATTKLERNGSVEYLAPKRYLVDDMTTSTESLDDFNEGQKQMQLKVIQNMFKPSKPKLKVNFVADDSRL